ncbi:MAG: hypothetical protein R3F62_08100 [Planctomycetota bacterium]
MSSLVRPLLLLLLCAPWLGAQDTPARAELISVRVVSAQGEGEEQAGQEPRIAAELEDWGELLRKLGMQSYVFLERVSQRAPAGTVLKFELPGELLTEVKGKPEQGGKAEQRRIRLEVRITKPAPKDAEAPRVLVLRTEVRVADGQEIVFRCAEGVPRGELIVIVGASEEPLE